jgi:hypothetical protein
MHPSEMKHSFLVAASKARMDGFSGTAEALLFLAEACAAEAQELARPVTVDGWRDRTNSPEGRVSIEMLSH